MMIRVVAVGRLRPALRECCDDYLRRLRRALPVEEREVRERGNASSEALQREQEGGAVLDAIPAGAEVVVLDQEGAAWTSEDLAREVDRWRLAARDVALVIGGAAGHGEQVLARASGRWSLGPLTLPHEIARLVVLEQLYRAGTILRGEPYHRGGRPG